MFDCYGQLITYCSIEINIIQQTRLAFPVLNPTYLIGSRQTLSYKEDTTATLQLNVYTETIPLTFSKLISYY